MELKSGDVGGLVFVPLTIPFLEAAFGEAGCPDVEKVRLKFKVLKFNFFVRRFGEKKRDDLK